LLADLNLAHVLGGSGSFVRSSGTQGNGQLKGVAQAEASDGLLRRGWLSARDDLWRWFVVGTPLIGGGGHEQEPKRSRWFEQAGHQAV
jgi:hypothetical protein